MTRLQVDVVVGALVLAVTSYDFTRVFVLVSTRLILEIAREAAVDVRQGGIAIGTHRLDLQTLWPVLFVQVQFTGAELLWARGVDFAAGP
jgi:hypothetical protein